jgi:hypothetical protein
MRQGVSFGHARGWMRIDPDHKERGRACTDSHSRAPTTGREKCRECPVVVLAAAVAIAAFTN